MCSVDGCTFPVWGKGFCKYHQSRRTDIKPYVYKRKKTGELELFLSIWEKQRFPVSFLSGKELKKFDVSNFAHVLNKKDYPNFRLNEDNIILLTTMEHFLFDMGTESARKEYAKKHHCDWDKIMKLKANLKDKYETAYK